MSRGILSSQISESSLALSIESEGSLSATSLDSSSVDVFGNLHDDDEESNANVDHDALSELIRKLKGQAGEISNNKKDTADSPSVTAAESVDDSETDMEDDLIERHLKALAQSTTMKATKNKVSKDVESDDEDAESDDGSQYYSDEESTWMNESQAPSTWDDLDDPADKDRDADVYNAAEGIVQKLLGERPRATDQDDPDDHKLFLQKLVETSTKYDYGGAPQTASTQNAWLAQLAKDLLREDSGSDDESSVEDGQCDKNISNLAKAAENAKRLMESSAKQKLKMDAWREKQRTKKPEFRARKAKQVLQTSHIEAKLAATNSQTSSASSNIGHEPHKVGVSASSFSDIDSVFTPVDRIAPDEFTVLPNATPLFPTFLDPVKPAAEIVVPIIPKKKTAKKKDLKVIVQAATEERSHSKQAVANGQQKKKAPIHKNVTYVDKVEAIKGLDETEPNEPKEQNTTPSQELIIPQGMPPYPGFGPKWPWHPNSARAPPGYRECYMHHMGDSYYEYMEYLRTRAETRVDDDNETTSEKILRQSLRQEAKFKKPKPALSPYTFTARPGKARENCAVGAVTKMPKIEEGSNSSSGSRGSSETNSFEKKIQKKKTQPDVFTVGKYHAKAKKGRKAKIVVVSGAELDQQAKKRQQQQHKKTPSSTKPLQTLSNHSERSEQPRDPVESHCMCTIM